MGGEGRLTLRRVNCCKVNWSHISRWFSTSRSFIVNSVCVCKEMGACSSFSLLLFKMDNFVGLKAIGVQHFELRNLELVREVFWRWDEAWKTRWKTQNERSGKKQQQSGSLIAYWYTNGCNNKELRVMWWSLIVQLKQLAMAHKIRHEGKQQICVYAPYRPLASTTASKCERIANVWKESRIPSQ